MERWEENNELTRTGGWQRYLPTMPWEHLTVFLVGSETLGCPPEKAAYCIQRCAYDAAGFVAYAL